MKNHKKKTLSSRKETEIISESENGGNKLPEKESFWSSWSGGTRIAAIAVCLLLAAGAFGASLKYLEESAKKQKLQAKNSPNSQQTSLLNSVNPFVEPPLPTSTPQLAKEYIYAGSRMLAVEDANASASPPSDLAVWRPSTGYWFVLGGQGSQQTSMQWGNSLDTPVLGDYDGDGKTDFSVFRPSAGAWYIQRSSDGSFLSYNFGQQYDQPVAADFDGDGKTDAAVVRSNYQSSGHLMWFIQFSSTGNFSGYQYGNDGDKPTPADFDGDGRADLAVWRGATTAAFYYATSASNFAASQGIVLGTTGDVPVPADYDGDGKADAAVRSGSNWKIVQSSTNTLANITWNYPGSENVPNDYDGDGKVDIAVWDGGSGGIWSIRQSASLAVNNGLRQVSWGTSGDYPVPAFYRR